MTLSSLLYPTAYPKVAMQVTTSDQLASMISLVAASTTVPLSTLRLRVRVGYADIIRSSLDVRCPSESSDKCTRYVICTPEAVYLALAFRTAVTNRRHAFRLF